MQEIHVEIRAVNARMAACAIAPRLEAEAAVRHLECGLDVALQAEETLLPANQQHAVHASVRRVARGTSLDFDGGVLKDEWAALFDVALRAGLPSRLAQRRAIGIAVSVVAIRAFQRAFGNPMMRRQRELRLNVDVASIAQLGLRLGQHAGVQPALLLGGVEQ